MLSNFKPLLLLIFSILFFAVELEAGQCQATTKKGTQCKRQAAAGSSYCWQHAGQETKTPGTILNTDKKSSSEVKKEEFKKKDYATTQCQATTKKGKQCSRKAKVGSKYCWQHGG
ncbi:MAG: hypothetical protein WDA22_12875 [Bacteroidota bacterium]